MSFDGLNHAGVMKAIVEMGRFQRAQAVFYQMMLTGQVRL